MAAPGSATTATSAAILKNQYTQPKVYWLAYKNNPAFAGIRKNEEFKGALKVIAVQTEVPQGGGTTIALAQANAAPGIYSQFQVLRGNDFGVARVTGEAMKAAEDDEGSLLDLWKREMDGILFTVKRSLAIHMQRNGTGSRGYISSGSNVATATITLGLTSDVTNFAVGMTVQAANGDGGTLRSAGATAVLTGINRTLGQLSVAVAWSTSIGAINAGDYLVRNGDGINGGTVGTAGGGVVAGRGAWITPAAPGTTYNGYAIPASLWTLSRSSDPTRLAGLNLNGAQMPMQEALQEMAAMIQVEGGEGELICDQHPRDRANLAKELGGKVNYQRVETKVKGSEGKIGFSALVVEMDSGLTVKVRADLNVPRGSFFMGDQESESFESLGPAPQILDFDKNEFLRYSTDDSYEVRVGTYGNYANAAPALWGNCQGYGQ
jgi:hypothetical protein